MPVPVRTTRAWSVSPSPADRRAPAPPAAPRGAPRTGPQHARRSRAPPGRRHGRQGRCWTSQQHRQQGQGRKPARAGGARAVAERSRPTPARLLRAVTQRAHARLRCTRGTASARSPSVSCSTGPTWWALASSAPHGAQLCAAASCACSAHALASAGARLSLVVFWTIRVSVSECGYVVDDKPRYNPDASIMEVLGATRAPLTRGVADCLVRNSSATSGCHGAVAMPVHDQELCVERALGHVCLVRLFEGGAPLTTAAASTLHCTAPNALRTPAALRPHGARHLCHEPFRPQAGLVRPPEGAWSCAAPVRAAPCV